MKHSLNYLPFDIIILILEKLNLEDSINFLISCKNIYNIYYNDKSWIDTCIIRKIFQYFKIQETENGIFTDCSDRKSLISSSFQLYKHFKNHPYSNHVDFLFYIVENRLNSNNLFKILLGSCILKPNVTILDFPELPNINNTRSLNNLNSTNRVYQTRSNIITPSDIQYLLTYCTLDQMDSILSTFTITTNILAYTVNEIYQVNKADFDIIIRKYINYILYKYHYNNFHDDDQLYFDYICKSAIRKDDTTNLEYILIKCEKYKCNIDYQSFVNQCIELEDTRNIKLIITYCEKINKKRFDKYRIIITNHQITLLCQRNSFEYLHFLVDNFIGINSINSQMYINSICKGLLRTKKIKEKLDEILQNMSRYVKEDNLEKIKTYIVNNCGSSSFY
jgi:hypothetical protein